MAEIWKKASKEPVPRNFGQRPWPSTFRVLLDVHSLPAKVSDRSRATPTTSSLPATVEEPSLFLLNLQRAPKAPLSWQTYTPAIQKEEKERRDALATEEETLEYAQPREDDEDTRPTPPYCAPPPPWDQVGVVCLSAW